jgi:transposase
MRRPAQLLPWLSEVELLEWLRDARTADEYRRRLTVWLTHFGTWYAHEVAEMVGVSKQAVWLWISQYNRRGPTGLYRQGRGGRRWGFLTWEEEEALLASLADEAKEGKVITAPQIHRRVRTAVGKPVTLAYVYRLLHRHGWRKIGPRPRHVKADPHAQEEFKKNSLSWSPP